jgi:two-component system cell cycle response regulator DivK
MKRILVAEDQEDLRAILRDLLTASGYTVIEAVDGAEGVAKARSEGPDLVLMDIQLPVLDGYDATRQTKALPGLAAIPIIAVSSFAMKGDEEKARASGCDGYVTKPYSPMQLRLALSELPELALCVHGVLGLLPPCAVPTAGLLHVRVGAALGVVLQPALAVVYDLFRGRQLAAVHLTHRFLNMPDALDSLVEPALGDQLVQLFVASHVAPVTSA